LAAVALAYSAYNCFFNVFVQISLGSESPIFKVQQSGRGRCDEGETHVNSNAIEEVAVQSVVAVSNEKGCDAHDEGNGGRENENAGGA